MRKFDKKVRWNFSNIGMHGYGRNVKEALLEAAERLSNEVTNDYGTNDFSIIESYNVISIDEADIDNEEEETKIQIAEIECSACNKLIAHVQVVPGTVFVHGEAWCNECYEDEDEDA